jgi:hypothetical protein
MINTISGIIPRSGEEPILSDKVGIEPTDRGYLYGRLANDFTLPVDDLSCLPGKLVLVRVISQAGATSQFVTVLID